MKNLITSSVFTHLNNSSSKNFRLKMFLITLLTNLTVISIITVVDVGIHGILFSGGNIVGFFNFLLQGIISSFFPIAIISFITISILIKPIYNVMKKNENGEDVSKEDSIKAIKRMVRIPRIILIIDIFIPVLISIVTTLLSAEDSNFIFLTLVKDISINLLLSAVQISLYQKAMSAPRAILKIYSIDRTEKEFFARHMSKIQVYASAVFIVSTMIYAEISLTQYISSSINPQGTVQNELLGKVKNNMNSGEKPPIIKNETPEALGKKSGLLILAVVLFTFPIVILANIIIDRSKDTQIKILKEILYSMSQGEADLTQRVLIVQGDTNGELSELLNNLLYKLQTMFKNVTSSANKVSESSAAIGNVLYKTVTATEEMVASVKQINSNADQFKHVVEGSQESLERTLDSLGKITENVSTQAAFVDQTSSSMEEMVANINSVNEVTAKANKLAEA
ncbi:MAG: methyl-accepting chemotaxis protein, partial [Spirochaetales bacterium]|nr:methyl-accepting chemotaxis protein [Spirochaetales bacterium]